MAAAYFVVFSFILFFSAESCPTSYPFSCGNVTLDIRYPFFTNISNHQCPGLHHIECMNLTPVIQFHQQEFVFPLYDILYSEKAVIVHDLKLSAFFRGSDCVFLYNFTHPIHLFNVSYLSQLINSGQSLFNCKLQEYDFSHDIFNEFYNSTFCNDYDLYYSYQSEDQIDDDVSHNCSSTGNHWFDWKLSFSAEENDGDVSLLSAGFSREWLLVPDCFDCQTAGGNCGSSNSVGNSTCGCSNTCRSVIKGDKGNKAAKWTLIAIGISSLALVVASLMFLCFCSHQKCYNSVSLWKRNSMTGITVEAFLERYGSPTPKRYSYSDVKKITKSFHERVGKGGYGSVFKGTLLDNGREVAVKMLNKSKSTGEEFFNEVASIGRTSHVNIVSLLGFCSEGSKRALIYDYMPNGSLEKFIYIKQPKAMLGWDKLFEIAVGIARGLEYLHRGCNTRIVHFDIKPHNILLDQDYCPKIADFGLAKLCPPKQSVLSMVDARGTVGYIAPEVFSRNFGSVTSKSDVYSYGMMVLEMVGGRRNVDVHVSNTSEVYFPHWIYEHLDEDGYLHRCEVTAETEEIARKMTIVGLWCIQTMPRNRPSMSDVIEMLEGSVQDLQIPPKPHLSSPS